MEFLTIFLISLGLTGDTLAVSITSGLSFNQIRFTQALRIAIVFAIFQALMPLVGWFLGLQVRNYIAEFDHWIAFLLLLFIGGKMIYESFQDEEQKDFNPLKPSVMIVMAIATSIDALVVGVSFAFVEIDIWLSIVLIWILTFFMAMLGVLIGKKTGKVFGKRAEITGGIILIGIGTKILVEHLFFH